MSPSAFALVAETTSDLGMAGFLVAMHAPGRRESGATIITIDIAPHARRSGVATRLMNAAEVHYREIGCTQITLEVAVDNAGAQTFYTRRGFIATGLRRGYYNGVLDAISMSKPLALSS